MDRRREKNDNKVCVYEERNSQKAEEEKEDQMLPIVSVTSQAMCGAQKWHKKRQKESFCVR